MTKPEVSRRAILGLLSVAALCGLPASAYADNVLKIGVLGVMSGPAASWGLVNKYCAETSALMCNAKGGVEISGEKYKIEIVAIDDKNDPKLTVAGAQRLINEEGIKYIIGPNVDTTAGRVVRSPKYRRHVFPLRLLEGTLREACQSSDPQP